MREGSIFLKWAFPACFCNFFFSFQSTLEQLTIFQMMMIGKKREGGYSPFYDTLFRESPKPSKNRLLHFPKRPSPSRDSNSACSERMQSLYRLRHHHYLKQSQLRPLNIRLVIIRPPIWKSKLYCIMRKSNIFLILAQVVRYYDFFVMISHRCQWISDLYLMCHTFNSIVECSKASF